MCFWAEIQRFKDVKWWYGKVRLSDCFSLFLSSRCTTCMNHKKMQKMAQSIYDRMTPAPPAPFYFPVSAYCCVSQCVRVSLRQKQREKVCVWVMRRWGKLLSSHLLSLYSYSLWVAVCLCVCVCGICVWELSGCLWLCGESSVCFPGVISRCFPNRSTPCTPFVLVSGWKYPHLSPLTFNCVCICMCAYAVICGIFRIEIEIFSTATPPEIVGLFSEEPMCNFKSNSWISFK